MTNRVLEKTESWVLFEGSYILLFLLEPKRVLGALRLEV